VILVIKNGKVIAYHDDGQDVLSKYPGCQVVQIPDDQVGFDRKYDSEGGEIESWPRVPANYTPLCSISLGVDKAQATIDETVTITVTIESQPAQDISVDLLVDGPPADEVQLVNGIGQAQYVFADPGKYLIEAIYGSQREHLFVEVM